MLRKSLQIQAIPLSVLPWDRRKCVWIANSVIIQCIVVFVGSGTILHCVWSPDNSNLDFDKLARIMYLYDHFACEYKLRTASALSNIRLPNDTHGLDVRPIQWKQALVTVSTRLTSKTRKYIELSIGVHVFWLVFAIIMNIVIRKNRDQGVLKLVLTTYFYYSVAVVIFDLSMAVVYIAHIQQSLTKGMVLRYSGWSVELKLKNYDDFAGWLPMIASVLWMRGVIILIWNIYCCTVVNNIRRRIRKREVKTRIGRIAYHPIPEPSHHQPDDTSVLYYRTGENKPFVKTNVLSRVFYNTSHN
ncbi:uncharacterized protein LOC114360903 [Ostrinia furnacalis]|uniref:uncharacterized protein LOC114360903 n=1 Tax=Ostrinia furnacalis TaxID=93504 RepID=UPI00103CCBA0|nr:uncharacterized protein LOC114360903 [Ostrinia furnacalis]